MYFFKNFKSVNGSAQDELLRLFGYFEILNVFKKQI